jgi:methylamine dehydrogenase accessory protein MauD
MVVDEGESLQLILASDGDDLDVHRAYAEENNLRQYPYVISQPLGMRMGVNKLPFAVLINKEGILRARGLVNSREHLESLVQADELDVSSLQEYLGDQSG